jgi:pseudouridine-5'-phosphate glycosidase
VESPEEAAAVARARERLGSEAAIVVANPLLEHEQLDPELHDRVLAAGLAAAETAGVAGKAATPFLLDFFHRETDGASLEVNVRIVLRNAELAARIAAAV